MKQYYCIFTYLLFIILNIHGVQSFELSKSYKTSLRIQHQLAPIYVDNLSLYQDPNQNYDNNPISNIVKEQEHVIQSEEQQKLNNDPQYQQEQKELKEQFNHLNKGDNEITNQFVYTSIEPQVDQHLDPKLQNIVKENLHVQQQEQVQSQFTIEQASNNQITQQNQAVLQNDSLDSNTNNKDQSSFENKIQYEQVQNSVQISDSHDDKASVQNPTQISETNIKQEQDGFELNKEYILTNVQNNSNPGFTIETQSQNENGQTINTSIQTENIDTILENNQEQDPAPKSELKVDESKSIQFSQVDTVKQLKHLRDSDNQQFKNIDNSQLQYEEVDIKQSNKIQSNEFINQAEKELAKVETPFKTDPNNQIVSQNLSIDSRYLPSQELSVQDSFQKDTDFKFDSQTIVNRNDQSNNFAKVQTTSNIKESDRPDISSLTPRQYHIYNKQVRNPQQNGIYKDKLEYIVNANSQVKQSAKKMPYYPQPRKFRADVRPSEHVVITENSHEHRLHKKSEQEDDQDPHDQPTYEEDKLLEKSDRNHLEIIQAYQTVKDLGNHLETQEDVDDFSYKLGHLKTAIQLHDDETSQYILENYKLLKTIYSDILEVKQELIELDNQNPELTYERMNKKVFDYDRQQDQLSEIEKLLSIVQNQQELEPCSANYQANLISYINTNTQMYGLSQKIEEDIPIKDALKRMLHSKIFKIFQNVNINDDDILDYVNIIDEEITEQSRINAELQSYDIDTNRILGTNYAQERAIELKREVDNQKQHAERVGRKIDDLIAEIDLEDKYMQTELDEQLDDSDDDQIQNAEVSQKKNKQKKEKKSKRVKKEKKDKKELRQNKSDDPFKEAQQFFNEISNYDKERDQLIQYDLQRQAIQKDVQQFEEQKNEIERPMKKKVKKLILRA